MPDDAQSADEIEHELIEECIRCGAMLDANEAGHYKSPDERFAHSVCHEEGVPEEAVLDLSDKHPFMVQVPRTYNCGHYAIGPPRKLPSECPECGVSSV